MSNDRDDSFIPSVNRRRLIQGIASLPVAAVPGWESGRQEYSKMIA